MMEIETLREAERKVKTHKEYVQRLEAVAKAANDYLTKCICYECGPRGDEVCRLGIGPCFMQELAKALAALEGGDPA